MQRKGWLVILGIGVLALGAWAVSTYRASDRPRKSGVEARLVSLETALVRLEARAVAAENLARLQAARALAPAAPAEAPRASAAARDEVATAEHEHGGGSDADPPPQPSLEERLEEAFEADTSDSDWTETAARRAVAAFSRALPSGSRVRDVDCRGALCRVEIAHAADGGHAELLDAFVQTPGVWDGPGSISEITDATGKPTTIAFLGQAGSDFNAGSVWQ